MVNKVEYNLRHDTTISLHYLAVCLSTPQLSLVLATISRVLMILLRRRSFSCYILQKRFYRAMHFSAKRGIAIACRLSVCLSVCPSVCLSVCDVGEL